MKISFSFSSNGCDAPLARGQHFYLSKLLLAAPSPSLSKSAGPVNCLDFFGQNFSLSKQVSLMRIMLYSSKAYFSCGYNKILWWFPLILTWTVSLDCSMYSFRLSLGDVTCDRSFDFLVMLSMSVKAGAFL